MVDTSRAVQNLSDGKDLFVAGFQWAALEVNTGIKCVDNSSVRPIMLISNLAKCLYPLFNFMLYLFRGCYARSRCEAYGLT